MSEYGAALAVSPAQGRDSRPSPSEDDDNRSTAAGQSTQRKASEKHSNKADAGAMVETGKKPRGRPPGSKNKPKPPIVITRDSVNAMRPHVLELSPGSDVVETVSQFARRRRMGLSVLSATGTVANVTLRHPTTHTATLTIRGLFDILSLTGTCLPSPPSSSNPSFTLSLAGAQGQVIGGAVAGALIAAGPIILIAASFMNPSFHSLPTEEEGEDKKLVHVPQQNGGADDEFQVQPPCNISIYSNCQLPSDFLSWPRTARSPY